MHVSKENVAGGGLAFNWRDTNPIAKTMLCMITLIMLLSGFTNTTPASAATDSYAEPVCSAGWKTGTGDLPITSGIPGSRELNLNLYLFKTCPSDSSIFYVSSDNNGPYAVIIKIYESDPSMRIWYKNVPVNSTFALDRAQLDWNDNSIGYSDSMSRLVRWIGIQDVTAHTASLVTNYALRVTGAAPIIQVIGISRDDPQWYQNPVPILDANGGAFPDGSTLQTPTTMTPNGLGEWTKSNTPTRTGYVFSKWTTDKAGTKPFTSATVSNGLRLYAQWEKDAGDPQKVDLDCSTGGRCELTVNYSGSTAKTREFNPGTKDLSWPGTPIAGVRLDENGYAADGACSDARCWYVSLEKEPQNPSTYQAQMPTTGAPKGLSSVGLTAFAVGLVGLMFGLARRVRD